MIELNFPGNPKMLRETLCAAQSLAGLLPPTSDMVKYLDHLQALVDECDRHRPLDGQGRHRNLHTETCGCEDKGHGPWCDHTSCESCFRSSLRERKCLVCGHDWSDLTLMKAKK